MRVDQLVAEYDNGDYEGLTAEQIGQLTPGWDIWRDGCPGGESTTDVGRRPDAFLHAHVENGPHPVVVVTHGHFSHILAARALALAPGVRTLVRQRNHRGLAHRRSPRRTGRRALERRRSPTCRHRRSNWAPRRQPKRSPGPHSRAAVMTGRHKLFATWKNQVSQAQSLTLAATAVEAAVRSKGLFELSVCPPMSAPVSVARLSANEIAVTAQNMG